MDMAAGRSEACINPSTNLHDGGYRHRHMVAIGSQIH